MITREEVDKIFLLTEWDDYKAALKAMQSLVGKILAERDELKDMESFYKSELEHAKEKCDEALKWKEAYRAISHMVADPIEVDSEAKRIFGDRKTTDAHLAFIDHELKRKE